MAKRSISGSRTIVTGASSGIGKEIALELCRQGGNVVATARREDRLAEILELSTPMPGHLVAVPGDICREDLRVRIVNRTLEEFGGLDILVNNAGIGAMGRFQGAGPERLRRIMEVNFFALAELTRIAIGPLKTGKQPMIVNVSSILGRRGVPHNSEYCASKFAVHGFSEALRAELSTEGIDVLVVSPGTTETEFFDRVIDRSSEPDWPEHRPVTAAYVARKTVSAIRSGKREIVPYFWGKVLCGLNRLSPSLVDRIMLRYA